VDILAQPFHLNESSTATIGVSIGIMLIGEDASVDAIPALMRLADEALYAAKSAGRGTFRYGRDLATEISTVPDAA